MLQVDKLQPMPSREYERLVEFCEGLVNQHPDEGLQAIAIKIKRYGKAMQLRSNHIRILDEDHRLVFKLGKSHTTYFTIKQINKNYESNRVPDTADLASC